MKKLWKRCAFLLLVLIVLCTVYTPAISAAQEPDEAPNLQVTEGEEGQSEPEAAQGLETENPLGRMLLDINRDFTEKIDALSKEENLFKSLYDIGSREIIQAYLCSLDMEECYQYSIYLQHELLILLQQNIGREDIRQEDIGQEDIGQEDIGQEDSRELMRFALEELKENCIFLQQKSEEAPLGEEIKQSLGDELFQIVYAEKYKETIIEASDEVGTDGKAAAEGKAVANLAELRRYLAAKSAIDIESIYNEMRCYRGESEREDLEKEQAAFEQHIDALCGSSETSAGQNVPEGGNAQDAAKDTLEEELSDKAAEEVKKTEKLAAKESTEECGEGVLEKAASRSVDMPPNPMEYMRRSRMFSLSKPKEEKCYEVYAKTAEGAAEYMEVAVSVEDTAKTYEAEKGEYELDGAKYNWRLRLPYSEMPLEGSDGDIRAEITAKNAQEKAVGRVNALAARASGIYSVNKKWLGSDFAKLNTNKNPDQVYYVYGTVYSDDCNSHYISNTSRKGSGVYSHIAVQSYDSAKATVRLRSSGYALNGTWIMIYGRIELNNLNIIGCGGNDTSVGLVSAKNCENTTSATRQSYLSAVNCSFSVANKWGVHGDRNSYLDVSNCTISNTKGGVGSHGEINIRDTTLNNTGTSYSGWAGVHLNVPITQGGFKHSMNLQNNRIIGYVIGLEYAVSNLFANQQVGNTIQSLSLTTTGNGNIIANCTTGLCTTKSNVSTPYTVDVQSSISEISNYTTGIHNKDKRDTFIISGGNIYGGNKGVENAGTFVMSGGNIYNNAVGIENTGNASMTNGAIHNNSNSGNGSGVANSGTFSISGGNIYNNTAAIGGAIFNQTNGTVNISGGSIYGNAGTTAGGGVYNNQTLNVTGGEFYSNSSPQGACIYQNGTLNMGGTAHFNTNNEVYLASGKFVTVTYGLTSSTAGLLTPSDYTLGRTCVRASYNGTKGSAVFQKFMLKENSPYLLRPGDYQAGSGAAAADVVISRGYTVAFNKNYSGEVTNVPVNQTKYWFETARIPTQTPVMAKIKFKGWAEDAGAERGAYQPGNDIHASVNKDMTLYAIWEKKIKVTYVGNYAESGTTKSEYVTLEDCIKNSGYEIKKNAGFTQYTRTGYSFAGWSVDGKDSSAGNVRYPENVTNKVPFEELMNISDRQKGMALSLKENAYPKTSESHAALQKFMAVLAMGEVQAAESSEDVPEVLMFDVWDQAPKLMAEGVQEFFEGTVVTKDMLLKNVQAEDEEDGNITGNIRITGIEYADGKLVNEEKSKGIKETWENDMPDDYNLDTWFQQFDREDSPVIHKITYAVSDSGGNVTALEWNIKVKYNEFPKIETVDRYFTLEEAKQGVITEETLLDESLSNGKLKVTDKEDDELYPETIAGRVELSSFSPEEFTSFEESGYVVLTYSVKDSMGPDGEGKETLCQFTVHVVKDGEITEPDPAKYVRFINQEYYEKNAEAALADLAEDEKERQNRNGGLNVDSKWYHDEAYKTVIASLWSDNAPKETWSFENDDVRKVKDYIDAHGIGNSEEEDALAGFVSEFSYLRS